MWIQSNTSGHFEFAWVRNNCAENFVDKFFFEIFSVKYETFDILEDEEVRQGLKTFSNWPTYPQLYVKGELLGGLDIVKEMQTAGELQSALTI